MCAMYRRRSMRSFRRRRPMRRRRGMGFASRLLSPRSTNFRSKSRRYRRYPFNRGGINA